ncbi:proline racemase family protein [Paracoccus sp. PS-1]|uniref:proline racemase family protein n=1 Tax=Paracoccus sp. PS1 TaxID=2963938 RepID=UPI0027E4B79D|nr:proline racemase family protein [Paracoccus sp. PS1]MDQ7262668.1 proline racemase family protein [Paracoccus sp. PS1]
MQSPHGKSQYPGNQHQADVERVEHDAEDADADEADDGGEHVAERESHSIIGGTFTAEILGETTVGNRPAVLPRITGQGYIFGRQQLRLDPQDPFAQGFAMSDTWGPQVGEL